MKASQLPVKELQHINTLGALKGIGYEPKSIKQELRDNLIASLEQGQNVFHGIYGYEDTVIPDIERALLSMHNIILLGLRGQAKTKIARMMTSLLDEYIPVIEGSELNEDPFEPITFWGKEQIKHHGDNCRISWVHREERYTEKLATPDVSVADLIGDLDPIKAASMKLSYSDERVIHYGLIPRSHRQIFVINELPDLQARIQVSLFNILQEGDIQIRGFKLRLPLDIQFVFTANPEDYTNRGSIVTPLKDRIDSQIITHYPYELKTSRKITEQEAHTKPQQQKKVRLTELAKDLIEQIAFEARNNEYVDAKSGVSARLTISAYENLLSAAERRALINNEKSVIVRMSDFDGVVPSITGKIELVYEGEQEGPGIVAQTLIGKAIRTQFVEYFPDPDKIRKEKEKGKSSPYKKITDWFGDGHTVDLLHDLDYKQYTQTLKSIPGLKELVDNLHSSVEQETKYFLMEFALHGLAEYSLISKSKIQTGVAFKDLLSSMLNMPRMDDEGDDAYGTF
jgi:magnesium chelatase subunit I